MQTEELKFTQAIFEATEYALSNIPEVFVIGLGVSYKNGADGTMGDLGERFPNRVLDSPVSEAALTGAAVGSSINGMRPIVHHGRVEFALFAADQIFTQAAKWNYMFGGNYPVPLVFRIAVGRQWGNGPQHTQALYSLFGTVPGLKVVIPSDPFMAKGLLLAAVEDNNPVVFLEPRWIYQLTQEVPTNYYKVPLDKARVLKSGTDITLVCYGDGVVDALEAEKILQKEGLSIEIIDLVSLNPIDFETIKKSVSKTGRLVTLDTTNHSFNIGSMVVSEVCTTIFETLKEKPLNISAPDVPVPTSTSLSEKYYPNLSTIVDKILEYSGKSALGLPISFDSLHLPPKLKVMY